MKKYMLAMAFAFVCGNVNAVVVEGQKPRRGSNAETVGLATPQPSAAQYKGPGPVRP